MQMIMIKHADRRIKLLQYSENLRYHCHKGRLPLQVQPAMLGFQYVIYSGALEVSQA